MEERGDFLFFGWWRPLKLGKIEMGGRSVLGTKKAREARVNEMAPKDELNGGKKETQPGLTLLIDSSQTPSFQSCNSV